MFFSQTVCCSVLITQKLVLPFPGAVGSYWEGVNDIPSRSLTSPKLLGMTHNLKGSDKCLKPGTPHFFGYV